VEPNEQLVHVYYSALNFSDVMTATGRLTLKAANRQLDLVRTDFAISLFLFTLSPETSFINCSNTWP
jgi:hypothetical protein